MKYIYRVEGDHPILRRVHDNHISENKSEAFKNAALMVHEIKDVGYENVKMIRVFEDRSERIVFYECDMVEGWYDKSKLSEQS